MKNAAKAVLLGLFAVLFSSPCPAYDDARVKENLKNDYGNCALYYQYVLKNSDGATPEQLRDFQSSADISMKMYMMFTVGETTPQIKAHFDFYNHGMSKIYREEGFDRLFVMYSDFCQLMFSHPRERINYWKNMQ